jgi:hypothetical protein
MDDGTHEFFGVLFPMLRHNNFVINVCILYSKSPHEMMQCSPDLPHVFLPRFRILIKFSKYNKHI